MAKMKIEVLAARAAKHGLSLRDRLVGYLPHYAGAGVALRAARQSAQQTARCCAGCSKNSPASARKRALPALRRDVFSSDAEAVGPADGREVVLFADTFNRAYERENLDAALRVLVEGGYRVHIPKPADSGRPLCCGRTFLSAGLVDQRARRTRPAGRDLRAVRRARRADRRPGAELPADAARRTAVAALGRRREKHQRACAVVRGISGARGRGRPAAAAARADRRQGPGARPLPPEILWRVQAGREDPAAGARI